MYDAETLALAKALEVLPGKIDERFLTPITPVGIAAASAEPLNETRPPRASLGEDPANFHEMPDETILMQELASDQQRIKLVEALKRANQVLHTPRVPAATWRRWREFERECQERLRQ